jgi:hypothetical protein
MDPNRLLDSRNHYSQVSSNEIELVATAKPITGLAKSPNYIRWKPRSTAPNMFGILESVKWIAAVNTGSKRPRRP